MNAKDFLALVEHKPPPWDCLGYDDGSVDFWGKLDGDAGQELADHAPQMAAAILRFLEAEDRGYGMDFNDPADAGAYCEARAALYDSLPKDLRP